MVSAFTLPEKAGPVKILVKVKIWVGVFRARAGRENEVLQGFQNVPRYHSLERGKALGLRVLV